MIGKIFRPWGVSQLLGTILLNSILLVVTLFWFSCKPPEERKVKLVDAAIMQDILVETHLLEARGQVNRWSADTLAYILNSQYDSLYTAHNITEKAFKKTFLWYQNNPDAMDDLYQGVIDDLIKREAEVKAWEQ